MRNFRIKSQFPFFGYFFMNIAVTQKLNKICQPDQKINKIK